MSIYKRKFTLYMYLWKATNNNKKARTSFSGNIYMHTQRTSDGRKFCTSKCFCRNYVQLYMESSVMKITYPHNGVIIYFPCYTCYTPVVLHYMMVNRYFHWNWMYERIAHVFFYIIGNDLFPQLRKNSIQVNHWDNI